jgi:hypothetical protein
MAPVDVHNSPWPLEGGWTFYLHYATMGSSYTEETAFDALTTVSTVPDFWRFMAAIPSPSALLTTPRREIDHRTVEGMGLFREHVLPKWEDPVHSSGGHWQYRSPFRQHEIDTVWTELSMWCVGETSAFSDAVTGLRLVDKTRGRTFVARVEVWCSSSSAEDVLCDLTERMPVVSKAGAWMWQDHGKSISMLK